MNFLNSLTDFDALVTLIIRSTERRLEGKSLTVAECMTPDQLLHDLEVTLILCQLSNPLVLLKVLSIGPFFLILSSFKGFCLYVYMYIGLCFVCVVVRFMDIRVCHCITML